MTLSFPRHVHMSALPLDAYCIDCGSGVRDPGQQVSDTTL